MNDDIKEDLVFIKNELESLNMKVDSVLDMLNNFTLMLIESEEDEYDSDNTWVPEDLDDDEDDDYEDDEWSNGQDES